MYPKKRDMKHGMIAEGDSLVFYPATRKAIRRLSLRFLLLIPLVCGEFVFFHWMTQPLHPPSYPPHHAAQSVPAFFILMPWLLALFAVFAYFSQLISLRRQWRPIVTLSPEGITIYTLMTQIGLIQWGEIQEVRPYNLLYRSVGIVPFQLNALYRRVGFGPTLLLRMNSWCIPLFQMFGIFIAPINIPQEYLPISADELATHIQEYRAASLVRQAEPGVWPPPPTAA
jgi:hypothetical protein